MNRRLTSPCRIHFLVFLLYGIMLGSNSLSAQSPYDPRIQLAEFYAFQAIWPHVLNKDDLMDYAMHGNPIIENLSFLKSNLFLGDSLLVIERSLYNSTTRFKCFVDLNREKATIIAYGLKSMDLRWSGIDKMVARILESEMIPRDSLPFRLLDILLPAENEIFLLQGGEYVQFLRAFDRNYATSKCNLTPDVVKAFEDGTILVCDRLYDDCYPRSRLVFRPQKGNGGPIRYYFPNTKRPTRDLGLGFVGAIYGPVIRFKF